MGYYIIYLHVVCITDTEYSGKYDFHLKPLWSLGI